MNQALYLFRLQQVDSQIQQADAQLAEINRLLEGDTAVQQARQQWDVSNAALLKAKKTLKDAEEAVQKQSLKIEQSESNLYGGMVKGPKELQDLQKEIASLKKHLAQLEDVQLEAMMGYEEAEKQEKISAQGVNEAQAQFAERSAGLLGQREQFNRTRERLMAERAPALTPLNAEDLQTYDRLRQRKNGVAVSIVRNGACSVCGALIRMSEVQGARASQVVVYCNSCGRILYAG